MTTPDSFRLPPLPPSTPRRLIPWHMRAAFWVCGSVIVAGILLRVGWALGDAWLAAGLSLLESWAAQ